MEPPYSVVLARTDVANAAPRGTSLVGRGITALNAQRQAALLGEAQLSRYQAAREVFDRQCCNASRTIFKRDEAHGLYSAYRSLRELADAGFMRACYPVAHFLSEGWRILPYAEASPEMRAADRIERIKLWVMSHALGVYQDHDLAALVAANPDDLVSVIEWCAEHYPAAIPATKAPPECVPLRDMVASLGYESVALAWLESPDSPEEPEVWRDIGEINRRGYAANDAERALECFAAAANEGCALAQVRLGELYEFGRGVAQDFNEAQRWYQLSAQQGNALAQCSVGSMFAMGRGVTQKYTEALRWYQLSAEQGDATAEAKLGGMHSQEWYGVEQDYVEALRWYELSAQKGNAHAQARLGWMYKQGYGVAQDYAKALCWFRLSAQQGADLAQYHIGSMYEMGYGVAQDFAERLRWLLLYVDQGSAYTPFGLGVAYESGCHGVTQDLGQAQYWYQKAADQNYPDATRRLAEVNAKIAP